MQYCEHCKVQIRGNQKYCPLCHNAVTGTGAVEEEIVPVIPLTYQYNLVLRTMMFLSISIIIICLTVNAMFPVQVNWPLFIIGGIVCIWGSMIIVINKRHNIPKTIIWQVGLISIAAILWDLFTGWKGWSLDFVLPIACMLAMIIMYVTAKVMRLSVRDFIIYILLDGLFGILPVLFLLLSLIHIKYPSILSIAVSALSLSAVILFEGENIREELKKRMHV